MRELNEEDEERQFAKPVGCMATLFHFFDRPHILSSSRREKFSSSQSQITESDGERSEQSGPLVLPEKENPTEKPLSPEPTRASLSAFKTTTTWKLREAPRLSLDSRLRPREIRTTMDKVQEPDDNDFNRRSPSVVARLMGVDILPTESGMGPGSPAQLCRSASESRVQREPAYNRFIDSSIYSNNMDYNNTSNKRVVREPKPDLSVRVSNPNPNPNQNTQVPFQRRSCFEPVDYYPDQKRSNSGEITLYGEIERRLRKRGIDEPCKDLETLKQILEALQLKGLLHSQPPDCQLDGRRSFSDDHKSKSQPPIVLMKPSPRPPRSPKHESALRQGGGPRSRHCGVHPRKERVEMDRMVRRSRSPDRSEAVKSPVSPSRRRPGCNVVSPKGAGQYGSNVESPKSPQMQKQGVSAIRCGKVRQEPVAVAVRSGKVRREVRSPLEDDTSPSVSDSSVSTSSPIDFERSKLEEENSRSGRHLLERCDKLLSSIAAFTSSDMGDSQPSPVSVLNASFLTDESSPSPTGKRLIVLPKSPNAGMWHIEPAVDNLIDSDSDEPCTVGSESDDPDYLYLCEFLRVSNRSCDLSKVSKLLEKRHQSSSDETRQYRSVVYDAVKEIVERSRLVAPWDAFTGHLGPAPHTLKQHVWSELQKIREPAVNFGELVDLNDATCKAIEKDFSTDRWNKPSLEISNAVLQIEQLVFKDLVVDTIRELADVASPDHYTIPRRKLVF